MLKPLATSVRVVSIVAAATGVLVFAACGDSTDSTFTPDTDSGAADGPISNLVPEGGGPDSSKEGGPASCEVKIADAYKPVAWVAPTKSAACSATDIDDYWNACLKDTEKTEKDGTCSTWKAAHATCAACAEPANNSGAVQWHANRKILTLNLPGCLAIQQNKLAVGDCGESYHNAQQCRRDACLYCFDLGGSYEQYDACHKAAAKVGVCASYEGVQSTACQGVSAPGSDTLKCFRDTGSGETFDVHEKRVIGIFCGPP